MEKFRSDFVRLHLSLGDIHLNFVVRYGHSYGGERLLKCDENEAEFRYKLAVISVSEIAVFSCSLTWQKIKPIYTLP